MRALHRKTTEVRARDHGFIFLWFEPGLELNETSRGVDVQ